MTDYNLIFGAVLVFNVLVTFRASSYWKKYFPGVIQPSSSSGLEAEMVDSGKDDEPTPLVGGGGDGDGDGGGNDEEEGKGGGGGGGGTPSKTGASKPSTAASDAAANIRHAQLLRKYLFVYLFAAMSDWLQGPYVYALYDAYGYSQHDIAVLFVAGFGSSMVFGSFVGGMADQGGRKKFVILFAIIYALSCMTKREFFLCPPSFFRFAGEIAPPQPSLP
jgi:Na+/melibiose symporter-like transporter